MYGDFQGIAGLGIKENKGLQLLEYDSDTHSESDASL